MSSSEKGITSGKLEKLESATSDAIGDSQIKSQGSTENNPYSDRPASRGQTMARASAFSDRDTERRFIQIQREMEINKATMGGYQSVFGSSKRRAAREEREWIKVEINGREYKYLAEDLEEARRRFKTLPELREAKAKLLTRLEARIAEQTKMRKGLQKFFALMNDEDEDDTVGGGKRRRGN
ncbi:hypothetical protein COCOBI_15-4440 [Coccomyxa sp. Obi]|nr:hypothetical protein COCOBI_15-4440 [Coccomyxa sp. Obi]